MKEEKKTQANANGFGNEESNLSAEFYGNEIA